MTLEFVPRGDVLEPAAVVATDAVARALGAHLMQSTDERLTRLAGVGGDGLLILLGPREALPWVDGVRYLGVDPAAPRLLLPTAQRPAIAVDVFERALFSRMPSLLPKLAVLIPARRVVSVADALPVQRERLQAWLEGPS